MEHARPIVTTRRMQAARHPQRIVPTLNPVTGRHVTNFSHVIVEQLPSVLKLPWPPKSRKPAISGALSTPSHSRLQTVPNILFAQPCRNCWSLLPALSRSRFDNILQSGLSLTEH